MLPARAAGYCASADFLDARGSDYASSPLDIARIH